MKAVDKLHTTGCPAGPSRALGQCTKSFALESTEHGYM